MKQCYGLLVKGGYMANQIEGVKDKLIAAATEEFLSKGFQNASLRQIAEEAGTSTNSIYVRFKDKEGLFSEIVKPVAEEFVNRYKAEMDIFHNNMPDMPYEEMMSYTQNRVKGLVDYVYQNYKSFKLLICCSSGTEYTEFIHKLADVESESTLRYMNTISHIDSQKEKAFHELAHILSSAYLSGFFETVKHDMSREEAEQYINELKRFFEVGWKDIFERSNV